MLTITMANMAEPPCLAYHDDVVRRATALLNADCGICRRYVHHLELADAIDLDELRGVGNGEARRWFLA